jgi:hypothetical protein
MCSPAITAASTSAATAATADMLTSFKQQFNLPAVVEALSDDGHNDTEDDDELDIGLHGMADAAELFDHEADEFATRSRKRGREEELETEVEQGNQSGAEDFEDLQDTGMCVVFGVYLLCVVPHPHMVQYNRLFRLSCLCAYAVFLRFDVASLFCIEITRWLGCWGIQAEEKWNRVSGNRAVATCST